ncbi:hypothetical protein RUND412_010767 [Rhizina undulata]
MPQKFTSAVALCDPRQHDRRPRTSAATRVAAAAVSAEPRDHLIEPDMELLTVVKGYLFIDVSEDDREDAYSLRMYAIMKLCDGHVGCRIELDAGFCAKELLNHAGRLRTLPWT